jgi:membrane protein required for colicin V production
VIFADWLIGTNPPNLPWYGEAQSLPTLRSLGDGLISLLPENLEEQVNDLLQGGGPIEDPIIDEQGTPELQPAPEATPAPPSAINGV